MKESRLKRLTGLLFALILILLSVLFFSNDFGILDLRKSSVVIGVGIDKEGEELKLTCQIAVPQPAENGENTQFTAVTGKGKTVACCLNEVNIKTGFYPKLVFCKLILLGESCFTDDINTLLTYFYSNEYTGLTLNIAACKGSAGDMMSMSLPHGDSMTDFLERLLSDEAQKSGNVAAVTLNDFGQSYLKKGATNYMPYIETDGQAEESGSGSSGGEQQGGSSGGSSGGGQQGGSSGSSGGDEGGKQTEFLCNKTAMFTDGYFKGVLDEDATFGLCLIKNGIRHTYTECGNVQERVVLGLRNCKGDSELIIEHGVPVLKFKFKAVAQIVDDETQEREKKKESGSTPDEALKQGEEQLKGLFKQLFESAKGADCDVIGVKDMLYKKHFKYYDTFKDIIYDKLTVVYEISLKSNA